MNKWRPWICSRQREGCGLPRATFEKRRKNEKAIRNERGADLVVRRDRWVRGVFQEKRERQESRGRLRETDEGGKR